MGEVGLPQCMLAYTHPGVGLETPLGVVLETPQVWAWRPPQARPLKLPLGVGLETCKACWDTHPLLCRHARHAGIHTPLWRPARHAGIPPLQWTEFLTHASENITLPQTSFAGRKNANYFRKGSLEGLDCLPVC